MTPAGPSIQNVLDALEKPELSIAVNVASGTGSFIVALATRDEVRAAIDLLRDQPEATGALLERTRDLAFASGFDLEYESPADVALAAHIFVAAVAAPALLPTVATIAGKASNIWWASRLADDALTKGKHLRPPASTTPTEVVHQTPTPAPYSGRSSTETTMIFAAAAVLLLGFSFAGAQLLFTSEGSIGNSDVFEFTFPGAEGSEYSLTTSSDSSQPYHIRSESADGALADGRGVDR